VRDRVVGLVVVVGDFAVDHECVEDLIQAGEGIAA
jgi:hypothetical protein